MTDTTDDVALGELAGHRARTSTTAGCRRGSRCPATPICSPTWSAATGPSTFGPDRYPVPDPERLVRRGRGERDRARRGAGPARLRPRPRALPGGRRHAPRAGRALPAPRCPPRGRRAGGGGLPALPVPRLEVRRRVRRVRRDPLRRREADPAQGPRPHLPDPRAQPHDLGLVPRPGRRAVLRGARGARSSTTATGRPSSCATSRSACRRRTWPRTTSTSPTSASCTAPTASPRTSSSPRAPTRRRSAPAGNFVREGYGLGLGRAAGEGLRHLPLVDHAARHRQRPRAVDLHRRRARSATAPPSRRPSRSAPASRRTSRSGRTRSIGTRR